MIVKLLWDFCFFWPLSVLNGLDKSEPPDNGPHIQFCMGPTPFSFSAVGVAAPIGEDSHTHNL